MFSGLDSASGGATCATFIPSQPRPDPACPVHANGQAPRSCPRLPMRPTASTAGFARHAILLTTLPLALSPYAESGTPCCAARGPAHPVCVAEMGTLCLTGQLVQRCAHAEIGTPCGRCGLSRRFWHAETGTPRIFFKFDSADGSAYLSSIPPTYPQNRTGPTTQKRVRRMLQRNSHLKV